MYLVGAGPGDPELITERGKKLLARAGCVIYDRLVDPALLQLARRGCERIYAGKPSDEGGRGQERINRLMVKKTRRHPVVVRLKGGDPAVFGRMSEELEALVKAGVRAEVVPGVSSAWAAAACAGIPLTDRSLSSSVAITTGHVAAGKGRGVRWEALARGADTLVILMGRAALPAIVRRLRSVRSGATPIALVRWASTPRQEVLVSTLDQVAEDLARRPELGPPVTAIVGEVVRRGEEFAGVAKPAWAVGDRPLQGKKILVTRPAGDQEILSGRLRELGARCEHLPTIAIRPRRVAAAERRRLLEALPAYDWVIFTSYHGVEALAKLAEGPGPFGGKRCQVDPTPLKRCLAREKVCAIGPRTAQAVRQAGWEADLVPEDFSKKAIARAFRKIPVRGKRILIPRSNLGAGDWFAKELRARGARVDEAILYETVAPKIAAGRVKRALRGLDAVTFTSGSTAESFLAALARAKLPLRRTLNGTKVVAIGPSTAQALRKGGVRKVHMPKSSWTVDGLVEAVVEAIA
ncbi:MAG: uroporphyrinogen-III C-methyltransferase [Candidatus Omnitrophica bacterium]|nr:uroporphyrinogen-III C-methyltransferase [Candidatus Omnitrophota bacterium]